MAATEKQLAHYERMRVKRAEIKVERAANPDYVEPVKEKKDTNMSDKEVWMNAFTSAMITLEIKSPVNIATCVPIADRALELFKARFKV